MICPKCGNEISEGHLYCEVCGEEIQIVPDFDLQVEESIHVTLSSVAGEVKSDADMTGATKELPTEAIRQAVGDETEEGIDLPKKPLPKQNKTPSKREKTKEKSKNPLMPALIGTGIVAVIVLIIFLIRFVGEETRDPYAEALQLYQTGNYAEAVAVLTELNAGEEASAESELLLADCYFSQLKYDECLAILEKENKNKPNDRTILKRMMECYIAQDNKTAIHDLLSQTEDQELLSKYADYIPPTVLFSLESGTYTDDEQLSLVCEKEGKIHYTLDGSTPTKDSPVYASPFIFDVGEHTVTAVFENEKGMISDPVSNTYVIEKKMLDDPVLLTQGGNYTDPELIRLEKYEGAVLYYTDDGEEPTDSSNVYIQPIPMPIREKTYKFIAIDSAGVTSQVIEATYSLTMATLVDVTMAENAVQLFLKIGGKGVKQSEYKCSSAFRINGKNYYLVEEYSLQTAEKVKTGRVYAVDVLTGETYKVDMSSPEGDYKLTPFQ
ncbi:MAG: chitobiase/beta-hexosaminidase C-terminal domain-containing protein [Lachnospiraceae bacterium]|nr:chitobiase/beta-hexosaminidase C-terminal domain-containing protein [Lachnospiraceae bacterium]